MADPCGKTNPDSPGQVISALAACVCLGACLALLHLQWKCHAPQREGGQKRRDAHKRLGRERMKGVADGNAECHSLSEPRGLAAQE